MTLSSSDDAMPAYRSAPAGTSRGTLIVVHEIFGLTPHIIRLCDRLAAEGYTAIAPDLFAADLKGEYLPYTADGKKQGIAIKNQLGEAAMAASLSNFIQDSSATAKVGVMGFCLGGTLAWLTSARPDVACVVAYYSVGLARHLELAQQAPVLMHFGRNDPSIPVSEIQAFRAAHPVVEIHEYDAGHAFNRDDDSSYQPASATQAWQRTMAFLNTHMEHTQ